MADDDEVAEEPLHHRLFGRRSPSPRTRGADEMPPELVSVPLSGRIRTDGKSDNEG